jgi:hypothetical protein
MIGPRESSGVASTAGDRSTVRVLAHDAAKPAGGAQLCARCGCDLTPGSGQGFHAAGAVTSWHSDADAIVATATGTDADSKPCAARIEAH